MTNKIERIRRRADQFVPACMALFMSALVSAIVTILNTGFDSGILGRWASAWSIALPVAVFAAYATRPLAFKTAALIAAAMERRRD